MFSLYRITNLVNGKKYIGWTLNASRRWTRHKCAAENGVETALYNAMRKYGSENFSFEVFFVTDSEEEIKAAEIRYVFEEETFAPNGYNLTKGGDGATGYRHRAEVKAAISERRKGISTYSLEKAAALSAAMTGNKHAKGHIHTPEAIEKIRESSVGRVPYNKGIEMPSEYCEKLKNRWAENPFTPEHRAKLSEARRGRESPSKGKKWSAEQRANLRAIRQRYFSENAGPNKGKVFDQDYRAKLSEAQIARYQRAGGSHLKGRTLSEETRAKMSAAQLRRQAEIRAPVEGV